MSTSPFSFQELNDATKNAPAPPEPFFLPSPGEANPTKLAVREYKPSTTSPAKAALIFYHGGGAHSGAGYSLLACGLAQAYGIQVFTPDLRGHGASDGGRGDAPSSEQVLKDINTVIQHVISTTTAGLPIFLGGHSSGGGLIVNYATWKHCRTEALAGYVLLSPQLGYLAKVDRPPSPQQTQFAKVNVLAFIVNGLTGGLLLGHNHAVQFAYSPKLLADDPGMVSSNTVNMANAITPTAPQSQFQEITDIPLGLWVGEEDELFVAEKVAAFASDQNNMMGAVLPGEKHLGIIVNAHKAIGPWILEQLKK